MAAGAVDTAHSNSVPFSLVADGGPTAYTYTPPHPNPALYDNAPRTATTLPHFPLRQLRPSSLSAMQTSTGALTGPTPCQAGSARPTRATVIRSVTPAPRCAFTQSSLYMSMAKSTLPPPLPITPSSLLSRDSRETGSMWRAEELLGVSGGREILTITIIMYYGNVYHHHHHHRRSGITSHTSHGHKTRTRSMQPVRSVPLGHPIVS